MQKVLDGIELDIAKATMHCNTCVWLHMCSQLIRCIGTILLHTHLLKAPWWYLIKRWWHSLQVEMLIKTCLDVILSFAHHKAKMHADC